MSSALAKCRGSGRKLEAVCGGAAPAGCVACASVLVIVCAPEGVPACAPCCVPDAVPVGVVCDAARPAPGVCVPAVCCEGGAMPSRGEAGAGPAALVGPVCFGTTEST